jgi:hypothetical protein
MKLFGWSLLIFLVPSSLCGQETHSHGAKELFFSLQEGLVDVVIPKHNEENPVKHPIKHPKPSHVAPSEDLSLRYWIELEGPTTGTSSSVTESRVFKSGEKIRFHFSSSTGGYIALAQRNKSGAFNLLFPRPKKGYDDPKIKPSVDRILPSEEASFVFDDNPSVERVLIIFAQSQQRLSDVLQMVDKSEKPTTQLAESRLGSKDLVLEVEDSPTSDVGTYLVSRDGGAVIQEVLLKHQG